MSAAAGHSHEGRSNVSPTLLWLLLYYVAFLRALPVISLAAVMIIGARALRGSK